MFRKDRLRISGRPISIEPQIPHRLDITNSIDRPPIVLNEFWLDFRVRSADSQLKILSDEVRYIRHSLNREINAITSAMSSVVDFISTFSNQTPATEQLSFPESELEEVANGKIFELDAAFSGFPKRGLVDNLTAKDYFFHTEFNFQFTNLHRSC